MSFFLYKGYIHIDIPKHENNCQSFKEKKGGDTARCQNQLKKDSNLIESISKPDTRVYTMTRLFWPSNGKTSFNAGIWEHGDTEPGVAQKTRVSMGIMVTELSVNDKNNIRNQN